MIVKVFTRNKIGKEVVLFECSVFNQDTYEVITDIGGVYESDFALALKGEFSVEIYTKDHKSEIIEIKSNNWQKNIESYISYIKRCYNGLEAFCKEKNIQNSPIVTIYENKTEIEKELYSDIILANENKTEKELYLANDDSSLYSFKIESKGVIYGSAA